MKIRNAREVDLKQLVKLWEELYMWHSKFKDPYLDVNNYVKGAKNKWGKFIISQIKSSKGIVFVAEHENNIVGFVNATLSYPPPVFKKNKMCNVFDFVISDSYRRKGIGKLMMKHFMDVMKKKNVKFVKLEVQYKNKSAEMFYRKLGFKDHLLHLMKVIK